MRVGIYDDDTYFLNRVCEILQEKSKGENEFIALLESDFFSKKSYGVDMLVVPKEMKEEAENYRIPFMLLTEDKNDVLKNSNLYIYKYGNVNEYLKLIKNFYSMESLYSIENDKRRNAKVITFFSLGGGMGSSTLAAGASAYFTDTESKVLYINLKPFTNNGYLTVEQDNISINELIFDIEKKAGKFNVLVHSIRQNKLGVSVLNNCNELKDFYNITGAQINKLIHILDKLNRYSYIIFDIQASNLDCTYKILECSDSICCVLDESPLGNERIKNAILHLTNYNEDLISKIKVICNKCKTIPKLDKEIEGRIIGRIDRLENFNSNEIIKKIADMRIFDMLFKTNL